MDLCNVEDGSGAIVASGVTRERARRTAQERANAEHEAFYVVSIDGDGFGDSERIDPQ